MKKRKVRRGLERVVGGFVSCAVAIGAAGCTGIGSSGAQTKTIGSSVGRITGAVIGHQYGETGIGSGIGSDLGGVAGSAVGSRRKNGKPSVKESKERAAETKFCPTGGERYPDPVQYCPTHGVALQPLSGVRGKQD